METLFGAIASFTAVALIWRFASRRHSMHLQKPEGGLGQRDQREGG